MLSLRGSQRDSTDLGPQTSSVESVARLETVDSTVAVAGGDTGVGGLGESAGGLKGSGGDGGGGGGGKGDWGGDGGAGGGMTQTMGWPPTIVS